MIALVKQIKRDPQTMIQAYENDHDWDSAAVSTTIERIEDTTHTTIDPSNRLRLAAYVTTLRLEDIWDAPNTCREHIVAADEKVDVAMDPVLLCPAMFAQFYP